MNKRLLFSVYVSLYKHYVEDHMENDLVAKFYSASVIGMTLNFIILGILELTYALIFESVIENQYFFIFIFGWVVFTALVFIKYYKIRMPIKDYRVIKYKYIFFLFFIAMIFLVFSTIYSVNLVFKI